MRVLDAKRTVRALGFGLIACLGGMAHGGDTGDLVGRLRVHVEDHAPKLPSMNAYVGSIGSACCESTPGRQAGDPREFVLYVDGLTLEMPPSDNVAELAQINQQFEPHVLGVAVGSTVSFPNRDPLFHNVFSYSKTKRFDLGKYGEGKTRTVTFDTPGLVQVFCEIHSNMSANILVVPSSFVAQPDEDGHYVLPDLPVGRHTISIWHPDRGLHTREVVIARDGTTLDLDF